MLDYGARLYDPLTARWNGVDALAEKYHSTSGYGYVAGNPVSRVDLDGREHYYVSDGTYIGKLGKSETVIVVRPEDISSYGMNAVVINNDYKNGLLTGFNTQMTRTQMLNRAHWVYGEGRGQVANYYAHTMKNLRAHGYSKYKAFGTDADMYKAAMKVKECPTCPTICVYPAYFDGTYTKNSNAVAFATARLNPANLKGKMQESIAAVLQAVSGLSEDPTNGAWQWRGDGSVAKRIYEDTSDKYINKHYFTLDKDGNETSDPILIKYYHIFFEYNEDKKP